MNAGCAGKTVKSLRERVLYLSALAVWSRQGAIQINIYLFLTFTRPHCDSKNRNIFTTWNCSISDQQFSSRSFLIHKIRKQLSRSMLTVDYRQNLITSTTRHNGMTNYRINHATSAPAPYSRKCLTYMTLDENSVPRSGRPKHWETTKPRLLAAKQLLL